MSYLWAKRKYVQFMGGKRLLDYDCKVFFQKRQCYKTQEKLGSPDDIPIGSKKGKLDKHPNLVSYNKKCPKD